MNIWNQTPFFRLLLPFLAGILTAIHSEIQIPHLEYILIGLFNVIALFLLIKGLNFSYNYSWVFGTIVTITLFFCGCRLTLMNTDKLKTNHFSNFQNAELYKVKINSTSLEKERSYKISADVEAVKQNGKWINTSGKAMCYFKKDSASKNIHYGDCIILKIKFSDIKLPQNPYEFNYKRFLSYHNIYQQAYIPSGNWRSLGINKGNTIISYSYSLREYLLNIYRENKITGDEFAVGSALVLGYTDDLDQDLISAYASSGALHVLSVSGLHVGIIYIIFNYLLFFLDKFKHGRFIKMVLLLFILWFYAILTGLSPSVLRSAAMFTFIVVANTWKKDANIFNTLTASCFGLLLYNPYLIMDVGFQLSYLAVFGIVTIQPWLYEKWQPKTWLPDQIWVIISVSIAAQLATFPLGLLYFHQFPNYFLFSNLIVIPVSTLILGYGLLMFVLGKISAIGIACGKIFSGLVWFLNESVYTVDKAPGALIQGISINILETWIIYAVLIFLITFFYKKQAAYLFASLSLMVFLLSIQTAEAHSRQKQKTIIIYDVPKCSAYDFVNGGQNLFLADLSLVQNHSSMLFHIKHNWWARHITQQEIVEKEKMAAFYNENISIRNNFIQFGNKRVAVVNTPQKTTSSFKHKLRVDLLIISGDPKISIRELQNKYDFKKIIFDSSNSIWKNRQLKKECEELKIDYYSVLDSGAYIEEM